MSTGSDDSLPDDSRSDASDRKLSIQQDVKGDRNQVIGQAIDSTLIANVETLNQIVQTLPRSPESARYSLSHDPDDFTGREDEIQQIKADLSAGRVVAIAGMAGVGKSALALRVGHQLKAQFPGAQIYLNLRGADTHPLTVEAALETLLRAVGVDPAQIPPELPDKVTLYRSRIAHSPTLVLLDNAANTRQVEDLLPGAGACLITSRRQLDGLAGIKRINLEALPEDQALALFQKVLLPPERVSAEAEAAHQIVGYCGRLPLALRIAAATLSMRSWQAKRLADYAQQLSDQRQRLDLLKLDNLDIRASFELSYRELDATVAELLGWLGLLPGDFGTEILLPLTEEPAEPRALATLVDGRLVDPVLDPLASDPSAERYVLHDLMRLFALEKLEAQAEPTAVQAAKVRLVQWCNKKANSWENALDPRRRRQLAEAIAADRATEESGTDPPTAADLEPQLLQFALTQFEAERQTLVQAFIWTAETQQWKTLVALAANLASFFQLRGYWGDWVSTQEQALTAVRQADDPRGEGQTLNNLGVVYQAQGKWNKAIGCYEQSLQICRAIGDVPGEGGTLNNLGNVYQAQGKWNEAIGCYEQSLQIKRVIGDVHGEGQSLANLGVVYEFQGKWNEAITAYEQSLPIFQAIGDVHGEGATLNNLGNVYKSQGKWNEAITAYEQSLQIKRAIGDVHGEGATLNNLGTVYQSQGKWNEAITAYEQSLQICRAIGNVHGEGQSLANLGIVYKLQKHLDQAIPLWREALTKLHPDSPEHATVAQWLQAATQPSRPNWPGWLLPLGILLFLAWNLINGHWLIALIGSIALIGWQWHRRRR
ncbi:MAG TPA: tetratricopeptide repeat protein [Coleofasciculaceae cyanobacterium]|jgi:tetratricopeptide (TPR) repeat protein